MPRWNYSPWVFILALLVCYAVSVNVRYQQFVSWQKNPKAYFVGDRPMMTTLDAPYWLRLAREYNEGIYGKYELRNYPLGSSEFSEKQNSRIPVEFRTLKESKERTDEKIILYQDVPMLSFLIAKTVPFFGENYYLAGTLIIPWLASLFMIPLGIYFYRIGFPSAGLLGGLVATFCSEYFTRSSIGRIDTDMLNLFFPVLASLLILEAYQSKTYKNVLLFSSLAGLSLFLFGWWYKAGFTMVYFAVLLASLILARVKFHIIAVCSLLFALFANPYFFSSGTVNVIGFLENYWVFEDSVEIVMKENGTKSASFPNVFQTISEAGRVPISEVLRQVLINPLTGWLGFLGFALLAFLRWRVLIPLLPMLALGLLGFQTSRRFIMFLAPFIGVGLGFLLSLVLFWILEILKTTSKTNQSEIENLSQKNSGQPKSIKISSSKKEKRKESTKQKNQKLEPPGQMKQTSSSNFDLPKWLTQPWFRETLVYGSTALLFFGISSQTAISFVPRPSIATPLYATFDEVSKRVPPDSALLTWWDFGYALTDTTKLATFHDGGAQFSPKTYFIARGLISPEPNELSNITQYLATEGNRGINYNNSSPEALLEAVRNPVDTPWDPVYLLFTADMIGKYGAFSKIGSWNLAKGGSQPKGYQNLSCQSIEENVMTCGKTKVDLNQGWINQRVPLKRVVQVMGGRMVGEKKYPNRNGYTLQIIMANPRQFSEVQLMEDDVYLSNFNQMFLLGKFDPEYFEETLNAFPMSRLFRFKFPQKSSSAP
ncbi:MAG: STT3 domain-containing protein [bacterium]